MTSGNDSRVHDNAEAGRTTGTNYRPPRIEMGRQLSEVTGRPAPVPSGAPVYTNNT